MEQTGDKRPNPNGVIYSESEKKLLQIMRQVSYGEVRVIIQDGKPVRIEELKRSIKL